MLLVQEMVNGNSPENRFENKTVTFSGIIGSSRIVNTKEAKILSQ